MATGLSLTTGRLESSIFRQRGQSPLYVVCLNPYLGYISQQKVSIYFVKSILSKSAFLRILIGDTKNQICTNLLVFNICHLNFLPYFLRKTFLYTKLISADSLKLVI